MSDQPRSIDAPPIVNRSMPPGSVVPVLHYPDVRAAVTWLCATFGFTERLRIGAHRAQILVALGAAVVIAQGDGPTDPQDSLMIVVAQVDQHHAQVAARGAQIVAPPQDFPFGERQYTAADLRGRRWTFSQSLRDVAPDTWGGVVPEAEAPDHRP